MREYLRLSDNDLIFVVETLSPQLRDRIDTVREDEDIIMGMLEDDRLFSRVMDDDEIMLKISPKLFFTILMIRARKDLNREYYTVERDRSHRIPIFDVEKVRDLINQDDILDYLIDMLVSFTKTESQTIYYTVKGRRGLRRLKFSDIDVFDMLRLAELVDEDNRFPIYKRIGDICLWTLGIFPEYAMPRSFARPVPSSRAGVRFRMSFEEYEELGRTFYRTASNSYSAKVFGLDRPLSILSEQFTIAEKPLNLISERYLAFRKDRWFISLN
ncbi:MAG TPA: hypothetical protein P5253_00185 [bacterium]|nr:hypothetical protein [bacterium]HRR90678.1 hypothetical protein [bacterium]